MIFPNTGQQNPGMNPNPNMNPNPQMGANGQHPLLSSEGIMNQYCQTEIMEKLKFIIESLYHENFSKIVPFLDQNQRHILTQLDQSVKIEGISQISQQFLKQTKERCAELKNNNQTILIKMFNIKQKMKRTFFSSMQRSIENQEQFSIVSDKIRRVKMDISNKLNYLKNRRIFDQTVNKNKNMNNVNRFAPINVALTELKNSTEIVDRELIKQREQIRALIKQLYDQTI